MATDHSSVVVHQEPTLANADARAKVTGMGTFPIGVANSNEPSGYAPPTATALAGYQRTYVDDFTGTNLPSGWDLFTGIPGGDPGGQFAASHVTVGGGLLQLNTWRDPLYQNRWVTGGLCHCGHVQTYGAYFVRLRVTGTGPNEVNLLWPANNSWPPEIDFNETGSTVAGTTGTLHFGSTNQMVHHSVRVKMTQWNTFGVIWSASAVTYLINGRVWAIDTNSSEIPQLPMRLDLEQRTMCAVGRQCPTAPVSMLVDWVAEYTP